MLEGEDVQYALQKRGQRRRRRLLARSHVGVYATKTNVCACLVGRSGSAMREGDGRQETRRKGRGKIF